ncbi:hypothetical protein diail_4084 [Diaporthe ilicicola]|nr:hypothetical protein diail_4084 [Diaporthe ilicicola]
MHVQSESHVRQMLVVGEDPKKAIAEFSNQFNNDFLQQLRTSHGTKAVLINHFYQEYIANKQHTHMNATRWPSLTERKELQDKGDEERELRMILEQQKRAEKAAEERRRDKAQEQDEAEEPEEPEEKQDLHIKDGEKVQLSFGVPKQDKKQDGKTGTPETPPTDDNASKEVEPAKPEASKPAGFLFGVKPPQAKNVFAQAKKNALGGGANKAFKIEQPQKMSEAERTMREEMDRKRTRDSSGGGGSHERPRLN